MVKNGDKVLCGDKILTVIEVILALNRNFYFSTYEDAFCFYKLEAIDKVVDI